MKGIVMATVLLVLFVLQGQAQVFAVTTESVSHCIELEASVPEWLPKLINAKPELYAAQCTEVKPFVTHL
jgi:hypothetical protein